MALFRTAIQSKEQQNLLLWEVDFPLGVGLMEGEAKEAFALGFCR